MTISQRWPVLILIGVTFLIAVNIYVLGFYLRDLRLEFEAQTQNRSKRLIEVLADAQDLAQTKSEFLPLVESKLERARSTHTIDYFILREGHDVRISSLKTPIAPEQHAALDQFNEILFYDATVMASISLPPYSLTVGINKDWIVFRNQSLKLLLKAWITDITLSTLLVLGIVGFFLKDILQTIRNFGSKEKSKKNSSNFSLESAQLAHAVSAFESEIDQLKKAKGMLEKQLYSAFAQEIAEGRKPPYKFGVTLARIDLNNFSDAKKSLPAEKLEPILDELFTSMMAMIERHGGVTCEYLGDELIFFFKNSKMPNASLQAASCVFDLFEVANALEKKSLREINFPLKCKASLSRGELEVHSATRGYEFKGAPLIESVRYLKEISNREDHKLIVDSVTSSYLVDLIQHSDLGVVELKGVGPRKLLYCETRTEVPSLFLAAPTVSEAKTPSSFFRYYQSEKDLALMLTWIAEKCEEKPETFQEAVRALQFGSAKNISSEEVSNSWLSLLKKLGPLAANSMAHANLLAHSISLGPQLLSRDSFHFEHQTLLEKFSSEGSPRLIANSLEVLSHFQQAHNQITYKDLWSTQNNRGLANLLISDGKLRLDAEVLSQIDKMIRHPDARFLASGVFALRTLAKHYLESDPVYFKSNLKIQDLIHQALHTKSHSEVFVQDQVVALESVCQTFNFQIQSAS